MLRSESNREWSGSTGGSFPIRRRHSAESSNRVSAAKAPTRGCLNSSRKNTLQSTGRGNAMDVIMPQLGETVEEGTVAAWHKKEGDKVAIDELLVEIETDKVATEVPSLVAGTLLKILVAAGRPSRLERSSRSSIPAMPRAPRCLKPPTEAPANPTHEAAAPVASERRRRPTKRDGRGAPLSPAVRGSSPRAASILRGSRAPAATAASSATTCCLIWKSTKRRLRRCAGYRDRSIQCAA